MSRRPVAAFFPDFIDPATLRAFAQAGVDAAREAGATYADIRVTDRRELEMQLNDDVPFSDIHFQCAYGLRVQVNGVWSEAFSANPTTDGIVQRARTAVATARALRSLDSVRHINEDDWAPAPVVRGEWNTPVVTDPFAVSPDSHAELLGAYRDVARRVIGITMQPNFTWRTETRTFASTEGTLITQRLTSVVPLMEVGGTPTFGQGAMLPVPGFVPASGGLECLHHPALYDQIKATAEETAQLAQYPEGIADVGRYDVVLDGRSLGAVAGATLAEGLQLGRALGQDADGVGTGIFAPPEVILGAPLFSPLLTATADRALPHYGAVQWDDEGVVAAPFPVITQGHVVDYFTTRTTAPALTSWYRAMKQPIQSRGCAVAWTPQTAPVGAPLHLQLAPGSNGTTLESLIRGMTKGVVARRAWATSDPQVSGGVLFPFMLYEVKRGQITRRLNGGALQFTTKGFWKGLTALGDESTVQSHVQFGQTVPSTQAVLAPAAFVSHVDVIQFGR